MAKINSRETSMANASRRDESVCLSQQVRRFSKQAPHSMRKLKCSQIGDPSLFLSLLSCLYFYLCCAALRGAKGKFLC